jgi:hypothetical protein
LMHHVATAGRHEIYTLKFNPCQLSGLFYLCKASSKSHAYST